jgi:hypothetical protein
MRIQKKHARHLSKIHAKENGRYGMGDLCYLIAGHTCVDRVTPLPDSILAPNLPADHTGQIVATNGRVLSIMPVVPCDADTPGQVPAGALPVACKGPGQNGGVAYLQTPAREGRTGLEPAPAIIVRNNGAVSELEPGEGLEFPKYSAVVPDPADCIPGPIMSGALLGALLAAVSGHAAGTMGAAGDGDAIRLMFKRNKNGTHGIDTTAPVRIESVGASASLPGSIGVIMPMTVDK